MLCPKCGYDTRVKDSRLRDAGKIRVRERQCRRPECGYRFLTAERVTERVTHYT